MAKITLAELEERILEGDLSPAEARRYFKGNPKESSAYAPALVIDETQVDVGDREERTGSAFVFNMFNSLERKGRQRRFRRRVQDGERKSVILSEGDSWFQFPLLLEDVIDALEPDFLVWSLDAAGDTLQNMVFDKPEYLNELRQLAADHDVGAMLLSGAGNDVIGKGQAGKSVLEIVLKPFDPGRASEADAPWYVDTPEFAYQLEFIRDAHVEVFRTVQREFPKVKVVCHGYDYSIPGGFTHDPRDPIYARRDQWLGKPFEACGFPKNTSQKLREAIIKVMLDKLHALQVELCGGNHAGGKFANAYHVDVRGTLTGVGEWNDEIHPTDAGFAKIGARFRAFLRTILPTS